MSFTGNAAGWTILTGTDVTDIDFNQSTVYIGTDSIEFKATAVATKIRSSYIEIPLATCFEIDAVIRRTSGTGAFYFEFEYFDAALNSLGSVSKSIGPGTNGVWTAVKPPVGDMQPSLDNRMRFIRITIGKQTASAEQFFLGAFNIRAARRGFKLSKNANQIIETGAGEQVVWEVTTANLGTVIDGSHQWNPAADNTTGAAHARKHHADYNTIWQFNARGRYSNLADGEVGTLQLRRNGSTVEATSGSATGAANSESMQLSEILLMAESDTLDVFTKTSSGSSRTLAGSEAGACSFSGWELSP